MLVAILQHHCQMKLNNLTAISPIDGRYRNQVSHLADYFSEYALIKYRILIEVKYFLFLADKDFFELPQEARKHLEDLVVNFSPEQASKIKEIESITNHDVKAVEYFLKEELENVGVGSLKEW